MNLPTYRRAVLRLLASTVLAVAAPLAQAQGDWPQQPVTFVMTFPAGSGVDVVARAIQEPLGKALGQPVIIDCKVGFDAPIFVLNGERFWGQDRLDFVDRALDKLRGSKPA